MAQIRRKALKAFSSTVWGTVAEGEFFAFDEGYKADLIVWGMIAADAPVAVNRAPADAEEITVDVPADDPASAFTAALTGQAPAKRGPGRPPKNR